MVSEDRGSEPLDPLARYSVLSLLSQTFGASSDAPPPSDLEADLDSIHDHLRSKALRSPDKLLEQAISILDSSSELMDSEILTSMASKDKDEVVAAKAEESRKERRPGLGRKRARFSFKPNLSPATVDLESTLDISQLKDPEEFFMAFERLENANREIKRQTGGVLKDLNQNNLTTTARSCRQGIFGNRRRPVHYRHLYPLPIETNATIISSQETPQENIPSPSAQSMQRETIVQDATSQEGDLAGSIAKAENKFNDLFDVLLSAKDEDLDGDGAANLLLERLQIKPIQLEKLCLPDLQDIRRIDLNSSRGNLPNPTDALSDIYNLVKGISSKSPVKHRQEAESSVHLASSTPPKSPFASISLLKKRIFQSIPSNDPFSAHNIDESPARNFSPLDFYNKQHELVDQGKELSCSGKLRSLMLEDGGAAVAKTDLCEVVTQDSAPPFDESMNVNSSRVDYGVHVGSSGSYGDLEGDSGGSNVVKNSNQPDANTDVRINEHNELKDKVEDLRQEVLASIQPDLNMEDYTVDELDSSHHRSDQSSCAVVEENAMGGLSKMHDSSPEQHVENIQEPSRASLDEQSKVGLRPRKERKRKDLSGRKSLAGAGTTWDLGVRRSTRIRSRPLEYWKGEKFLYGRIHESLATVIGLKYVSPAKGGETILKVKSFVSDEYKELVERVARH